MPRTFKVSLRVVLFSFIVLSISLSLSIRFLKVSETHKAVQHLKNAGCRISMPVDVTPTFPDSVFFGDEYFREYNLASIFPECELPPDVLVSHLSRIRGLIVVEYAPGKFADDQSLQLKRKLPGVRVRPFLMYD